MIKLTNVSGGQIVCDLKSGETLRLNNRQETTIKDSDMTKYLQNLNKQGIVVAKNITDSKVTTKEVGKNKVKKEEK